MRNRNAYGQLQRYVGVVIQNLRVEYWSDPPNALDHLICVAIEFANGDSLILSCAGDGGISVRKGKLEGATGNRQLRTIHQTLGQVIRFIECDCDSVTLFMTEHQVRLSNHDDELEMTVNGRKVSDSLDDSAMD